jgi:hypothetical protein
MTDDLGTRIFDLDKLEALDVESRQDLRPTKTGRRSKQTNPNQFDLFSQPPSKQELTHAASADQLQERVEALLMKGILKKTLVQMADALINLQIALQKTENLDPALAKMEAWNRLMRHEEDEVEEAKAWGMTLEEYRNRPSA